MTKRFHLCLPMLAVFFLFAACQSQAPQEPADDAQEPAASATEAVEFEPAYPTDVSEDTLDEQDVSQQEAVHAHGEETHSHGDGEHSHGDGEQTHEDGEGHDDSDHQH